MRTVRADRALQSSMRFLFSAVSLIYLMFPLQFGYAQSPPEVSVHFQGGFTSNAVLLYVNDSGVLIDVGCEYWDDRHLPSSLENVRFFSHSLIDSVVIPGKSGMPRGRTLIGGIFGFFAGFLTGALIAGLDNPKEVTGPSPLTGLLLGMGGGTVLGIYLASSIPHDPDIPSVSCNPADRHSREKLRGLCVYPVELPDALGARVPEH